MGEPVLATVANSMFSFAIMLALGMLVAKLGIASRETIDGAITISLKVLLPLTIFSFIYKGTTPQNAAENLPIAAFAAVFYLLIPIFMAGVSRAQGITGARSRIYRMTFIFGNTSFIGLPLLKAVYPASAAPVMALFMLVDQAVIWTYGVHLASGEALDARSTAKRFANPNLFALLAAFALVLAGIPLPQVVIDTASSLGDAATPLCMVCLGALFYYSDVRKLMNWREFLVGVGAKMIIVPLAVSFALNALLPQLSPDTLGAFVLLAAMPATTLVPLIAETYGDQGEFATVISVATIFASTITVPLVAALAL